MKLKCLLVCYKSEGCVCVSHLSCSGDLQQHIYARCQAHEGPMKSGLRRECVCVYAYVCACAYVYVCTCDMNIWRTHLHVLGDLGQLCGWLHLGGGHNHAHFLGCSLNGISRSLECLCTGIKGKGGTYSGVNTRT
jgi:hypothetical protein